MPALERVAGRPTWLLSRANARAQGLLGEALASEGFRGYHFRLLAALDQYGASSQAELGRHTGIDRSDVVATLNDLVAGGLARREPDPVDRRRNIVKITRRGQTTLAHLVGPGFSATIHDLALVDYADVLDDARPSWVAGALVTI